MPATKKQPATKTPTRKKAATKQVAPKQPAAKQLATKSPAAKQRATKQRAAKQPATKAPAASKSAKSAKSAKPGKAATRMTFAEAMAALEAAGSEQTRKTYARHGATGPMFGVSFATLKALTKRIGVDHELALALWDTGNLDARNLATKVADPARLTAAELDRWASVGSPRMCGSYVAMLAAEGPHGASKLKQWLAASSEALRCSGWVLLGQLATHDEAAPDAAFIERIAHIEKHIHGAPNAEREAMNSALIQLGCRNAALRKAATAAAKRIGKVDVDHGDTACKTPDAAATLDKTWAHSTSKGFASPAAHERSRERLRLRC